MINGIKNVTVQLKKHSWCVVILVRPRLTSILCMIIGRKGIEPSTALAIEFTAQPIIPTNRTLL